MLIIITRFSCQREGACADKLHVKATKILPLDGRARSTQDPINRGHNAQYSYQPPPASEDSSKCYTVPATGQCACADELQVKAPTTPKPGAFWTVT